MTEAKKPCLCCWATSLVPRFLFLITMEVGPSDRRAAHELNMTKQPRLYHLSSSHARDKVDMH